MYSSLQTHRFSQDSPRFTCKYERQFLETSLVKGFEVKCRQARCSIECNLNECNLNWARKHDICLTRHLKELTEDMIHYRGNLTMPPKATPTDHRKTKKQFLQIINRWKSRNGYTVEIHVKLDITSPSDAHWDTVVYSDAPKKSLKSIISDA